MKIRHADPKPRVQPAGNAYPGVRGLGKQAHHTVRCLEVMRRDARELLQLHDGANYGVCRCRLLPQSKREAVDHRTRNGLP